jgi:hypothetical protein
MSEGRNPMQYLWDDPYEGPGPAVALLEGQPQSRRQLEGRDPQTPVVVMLMDNPEEPWNKRYSLYREANGWVDIFRGFHAEWTDDGEVRVNHADPWPIDLTVFTGEDAKCMSPRLWHEDGLSSEDECGKQTEAIINGFSGPGYVAVCLEHAEQLKRELGAQVWRPVVLTLAELDDLMYAQTMG